MAEDLSEYLEQDIVGLVLQYLQEKGFNETAHLLEKESRYHFDMDYFESLWVDGKWDTLVSYLSGFVKTDKPHNHSVLYFEIIKQKFLEALDKILTDEIRVFFDLKEEDMDPSSRRVQIYNEFAMLLTFDDFRKHGNITWIDNARETRKHIFPNLKAYVTERIPIIKARSSLPPIHTPGRLRTIINQSLNWQMSMHAPQPAQRPRIQTLFIDHNCFDDTNVDYGNYAFYRQTGM